MTRREELRAFADRLEDPDHHVLLAYEVERIIAALGWRKERGRTVPGHEKVEGWLSPRGSLFSTLPRLGYSFDHSLQILPFDWSWLKRGSPVRVENVRPPRVEFVILNEDGREIGACPVRLSRYGLPTHDAAALTAAALRAHAEGEG